MTSYSYHWSLKEEEKENEIEKAFEEIMAIMAEIFPDLAKKKKNALREFRTG